MAAGPALLGRDTELRSLDTLIAGARNGRGGALILTGDAGIGKTTLLAAAGRGAAVRVLRVDGYEAEATMPYAAVQRLTAPLRDHLDDLPDRHRAALHVAAGLGSGPPPDRYLVGLGALGLLAKAGEAHPLVCVVDDAHLLDPESLDVIAFVSRRLQAEAVAVLLAGRDEPELTSRTAGIPALPVGGLPRDAAVRLLTAERSGELDPAVASSIATATGGNPLALVDLARDLTPRQLIEAGFGAEPVPIGRHLEQFYLRRVRALGEGTRAWLLVVAADSTGNLDLVDAAGTELGLPRDGLVHAEEAGLVDLADDVRFRHPLVRSAAYNAAPGRERRRVHQALSRVADALGLDELSVWHAAKGTLGTDESVAARLEDVADEAARRGGSASRARMLVRAAALTPPGARRNGRLVRAAEAALAAGTSQLAKDLTDEVDEDDLDEESRARLLVLGADVALFTASPSFTRAAADVLRAAGLFRGVDVDAEQSTLLKVWEWALPAERLAVELEWPQVGRRLREGAELREGPAAVVLRALAALILDPYPVAVPSLRAALAAFEAMDDAEILRYGQSSVAIAGALWDERARRRHLERWAQTARDVGALQQLDTALWVLAVSEANGCSPRRAALHMDRVRELRRAIGYDAEHVVNVPVLAWQGVPRAEVLALAEATRQAGFGGVHSSALAVLAVVDLAEGRPEEAFAALDPLVADPFFHSSPLSWADHAEAAFRTGRRVAADSSAQALADLAAASGSPWAHGVSQRLAGLMADTADGAEECWRMSVDVLSTTEAYVDLGRAHLQHGEWLRRRRRRAEAREALHRAAEVFRTAGATPFLDRVTRELQAIGEPATPAGDPVAGLTAQELTVARLVADGATNAEVAATMFLSPNTVDYHLRKVFAKFRISSRRQLADRLRDA